MKKVLTFLAFATALNVSVAKAYPPPQLLDDSASFRIAKSVKLGYGDASAPSMDKGTKKAEFNTCSSDGQCTLAQKCVNGKCEPACTSTTCSGETPDCIAQNHTATCKCSETSCGAGKQCVDGKCETCTVGSTCNCSGEKVIDAAGQCICPSSVSCSAGQYVSGDCSCKSCRENEESSNRCGCPGNTVPDGSGSCHCKTTKTCGEGYSFDSTNTCECVPCTDNASCDNPCPAGSFPNGSGCGTYACTDDTSCAAGNRCENGGTESAQCVPCGKNEQCNCPDGQLSDGSGKCVPVVCKTGLVCSDSVTAQCCDAGMQCVNPDTVESYCAACEVDTQCTCPAGYVVNSAGKCVKPVCAKDGDCANGTKCDNAGKSDAKCIPCDEGETCTCTGGMIADGKGGCKFGCEFESAAACKSGTANCTNCSVVGGCNVCSACGTGYELSGGSCSPKACPTGYATDVSCDTSKGYTLTANGYSGSKACVKCEVKACPSGYSTDKTSSSCGAGYTFETNGYSGGKACGTCVAAACPEGYSTSKTSCAKSNQKLETNGYSGGSPCGKCVPKTCAEINSSYKTSCPAGDGKSYADTGSDGDCYTCKHCDNSSCPGSYKCVDGNCTPACFGVSCSGTTPVATGYNHECVCECDDSSCPSGQYCDRGSPRKCVQNKTCAAMGYVTSCKPGYTPTKVAEGSDGTCYTCACNNGYESSTPVKGYYCVPCGMAYGPCSKCTATGCTVCTSPLTLNPKCSDGQYLSKSGSGGCGMCNACPANCTKCTDANTCTACASGYTLKNGKCEKVNCTYDTKQACMNGTHRTDCTADSNGCYSAAGVCQSGYWWGNTGKSRLGSSDSCSRCSSAATTCYDNKLTCKAGYTVMGGGNCYECSKNCGTCKEVGPSSCYTCASGYYTFNRRSTSTPGYCCTKQVTDITQCVYN